MNLIRTAFVVWTVILVNDDGVGDVIHNNVSKHYVSHKSGARLGPWFYPNPIIGSGENRICHRNILYSIFLGIFTQTPNAAALQRRCYKLVTILKLLTI